MKILGDGTALVVIFLLPIRLAALFLPSAWMTSGIGVLLLVLAIALFVVGVKLVLMCFAQGRFGWMARHRR